MDNLAEDREGGPDNDRRAASALWGVGVMLSLCACICWCLRLVFPGTGVTESIGTSAPLEGRPLSFARILGSIPPSACAACNRGSKDPVELEGSLTNCRVIAMGTETGREAGNPGAYRRFPPSSPNDLIEVTSSDSAMSDLPSSSVRISLFVEDAASCSSSLAFEHVARTNP